jgi:hypothetical protein
MYQEWTRDFRCCKDDCESAILHLKDGNLLKWYETKTQSLKSSARSMLRGVYNPTDLHQLPDEETHMMLPTDLATMERRNESTRDYNIVFMTPRIANIVADVQREKDWAENWWALKMYFRNPETREVAGKQFQKMFLEKLQKDPSKMPPCFEMGATRGMHSLSRLNGSAAMPWKDLGQQPTLEYISVGKDADGSLYSKKELRAVMDAAMDKDSPPIHVLIPCAQNWASWDAAVIIRAEGIGKGAVHVISLQTTLSIDHEIQAKGLNQLRDAISAEWTCGEGVDVHYHSVLVRLFEDGLLNWVPEWRDSLVSSKGGKKDPDWRRDNLTQYIMFVSAKELLTPFRTIENGAVR